MLFMIVCVLVCVVICITALRLKSESKHIKMTFGVLCGAFCLLIALTMIATGRTYRVDNFAISDAASKCTVIERKNTVSVTIKGQEFVTAKDNVVYCDASDKESEVCEINGQKRVYETSAPSWLYKAYFLAEPAPSIEYAVTSCYISKAK